MDEKNDMQLGTAIKLLFHRGRHKAVNLLLSAEDVVWEWKNSDWGIEYYELGLVVDIDMFDEYHDDEVFGAICNAFCAVMKGQKEGVSAVNLYPALVRRDWRKDVESHLRGKPSNQAALVKLPDRFPVVDSMRFRDGAETAVYSALKAKQEALPATDSLTIIPNASVRIPGHTWEPDFVVLYRGRAGVIEVDGGSHRKKYAADKSRDKLLEDAGITRVERIDVGDAENPHECQSFVDSFLRRLLR